MTDFYPVYIYSALVVIVTLLTLGASGLFRPVATPKAKYMPYESGIQTETRLLEKRFPLKHYLVALIYLVFDIEVIFLYPWAVVAKEIGPFAFYEMIFFWVAMLAGFAYVRKKRGLQWE